MADSNNAPQITTIATCKSLCTLNSCCAHFTNYYYYGDQITVNETSTACCMQQGTDDQCIQNVCWTL